MSDMNKLEAVDAYLIAAVCMLSFGHCVAGAFFLFMVAFGLIASESADRLKRRELEKEIAG